MRYPKKMRYKCTWEMIVPPWSLNDGCAPPASASRSLMPKPLHPRSLVLKTRASTELHCSTSPGARRSSALATIKNT